MKQYCVNVVLAVLVVLFSVSAPYAAESQSSATQEPVNTAGKKTRAKAPAAKADLMDINTASAAQLKTLPGITGADAEKILAGRPYARKNQLKQKNIITAATYEGIKTMIVAKKAAK